VRFAFAFAPHPTRTGWARDRRPRAPRFVFLFFTSPLPFRVLFLFVSFRFRFPFRFISFFSPIFGVSRRPFSPFRLPPHSPLFTPIPGRVCFPLVCLARWRRMGPRSPPSFALVRPRSPCSLATKRIASGWVFSRFSRVRLSFSRFSRAHALPTLFCINGDALSCKKKSMQ
jgi:hypothetical protein